MSGVVSEFSNLAFFQVNSHWAAHLLMQQTRITTRQMMTITAPRPTARIVVEPNETEPWIRKFCIEHIHCWENGCFGYIRTRGINLSLGMYQEIHPDTIGYMPISIARVKTKTSLVIMRECSLDHHYYPKDKKSPLHGLQGVFPGLVVFWSLHSGGVSPGRTTGSQWRSIFRKQLLSHSLVSFQAPNSNGSASKHWAPNVVLLSPVQFPLHWQLTSAGFLSIGTGDPQ